MADFFCTKYKMAKGSALVPAHETDEEALKKLPVGAPLRVKVTRIRNVDHHRKFFALLNYAFDVWEPNLKYEQMEQAARLSISPGDMQKNFERFRADIIILAGFYETTYRLDGTFRIEPKSISFASMDQDEFDQLYDKAVDTVINHVQQLDGYSPEELKNIIDQVMEFAA